MSPEVYNKIIFDQNHSYRVESNVSQQVFQSFVNYMINDEEPDVTIETYNQYYELSQEFHLLNSLLTAKKEFFGEFLININGINKNFRHNCEKSSSKNSHTLFIFNHIHTTEEEIKYKIAINHEIIDPPNPVLDDRPIIKLTFANDLDKRNFIKQNNNMASKKK